MGSARGAAPEVNRSDPALPTEGLTKRFGKRGAFQEASFDIGWRLVSALCNRERLMTGTR